MVKKAKRSEHQSGNEGTDKLIDQTELIVLFLFYDVALGKQGRLAFSKEFKHCNSIVYDGRDFILIEWDSEGLKVRSVKAKKVVPLIRNIKAMPSLSALLCVSVKQRKRIRWKPYVIRSCNEVARYSSGCDIGLTFNPVHLYNKLLRYANKRNYDVLSAWRRTTHGQLLSGRTSSEPSK